jgi:hypothetical protein
MSIPKKKYRYMVEYIKRGKWVPVLQTDHEDIDSFEMVANAEEYQYRILLDGEDVTARYKIG